MYIQVLKKVLFFLCLMNDKDMREELEWQH